MANILTCYLTLFWLFWHSSEILSDVYSFWYTIWHFLSHTFWHLLSDIYTVSLSDTRSSGLSDLHSDILSDIYSDILSIYLSYTGYWWVRTCGPGWVRTCWGLVLSLVSTVWSAYGELARIATWVRSFGTWDLPKLPTHVRWTRSETWMQVWKNTLINDRDFMFCGSSKGWWDRKLQWF